MQHATHAPTRAERDRIELLVEIGCVVCLVYYQQYREPDVSHLLDAGSRIGHQATIPECPWHHRGVPTGRRSPAQMRRILGPCRAHEPAAYAERFGSDADLREMADALMTKTIEMKRRSPIRQRRPAITSEQVEVSQWTIVGEVAVKTRSMGIAKSVAERAEGSAGFVDGVEWMSLSDFQKRTA
jgi:Recombination enhancement, RecA-dependent nuclease